MPRKMTRKQIKYFGTKSQRAGLRRRQHTGAGNMVRHRRRSYSRSFGSVRRRGTNMLTKITKPAIGGGAYGVVEPLVSSLPFMNTTLGKVALGAIASQKSGIIGDAGKAIITIESYKFAQGAAGGILSGVGAAASAYVN